VLAFPSNDFRQERGSNEQIDAFVQTHHPNCGFTLFEKNRLEDNIVFQTLKRHPAVKGRPIRGNFYKYLVDRNGIAVSLHEKREPCFSFEDEIVQLLKSPLAT